MGYESIGRYLLGEISGDTDVLDRALERQAALERQGRPKLLGEIVLEEGILDAAGLDRCLHRQRKDFIGDLPMFACLSAAGREEVASVSRQLTMPPDTLLFRQGAPGDALYGIIGGSVRVFQVSEDGVEVTLATLHAGDAFGEIALLAGGCRSASVATLEKTTFAVVPKGAFDQIVSKRPEIAAEVVKILAGWLLRGDVRIVEAAATQRAYQRFVSAYAGRREPELTGTGALTRRLRARIEEAAAAPGPVLIAGEPGTEMWDVGGLVHRQGECPEGLLLTMDAATVALGDGSELEPGGREPGEGVVLRELAQSSILFGHCRGAVPSVPESRLGLLQIVERGTVIVENVDRLAPSVQERLADFIQHGTFTPLGMAQAIRSQARIIATTTLDPEALMRRGELDGRLARILGKQVIQVPPLRRRKKDLRAIVERLVTRFSEETGKGVTGIEDAAYQSFMAYDWPGNTEELTAVVRRAVSLARSERLAPEDVFIAPPPVTGRVTFNLLRVGRIARALQSRWFPRAGQVAAGGFMALVVILGLFGEQSPARNAAVVLTWGIWEPLVIGGALLLPRIWCSVCPVGAASGFVSRTLGAGRKIPQALRTYGALAGAAGVGVIFWSESAAHMLSSPRATALLVGGIALLALLVGLVYQRRAWCRYLCPLGGMVGVMSACSAVELRANYGVCATSCERHDCYTGNEKAPGCPVFEGPFSLRSNQQCILCGNCIRSCPHNSPVLNLRLPGHELWTVERPERAVVVFALALFATQLFRGAEAAGWVSASLGGWMPWWTATLVFLVMTAVLVVGAVRTWGRMLFPGQGDGEPRDGAGLVTYGLIPLIAAFELGFHLERLVRMGGLVLPVVGRQAGFAMEGFGGAASPSATNALQVLLVILGTAGSLVLLGRLMTAHREGSSDGSSLRGRWPLLMLGGLYCWMFLNG